MFLKLLEFVLCGSAAINLKCGHRERERARNMECGFELGICTMSFERVFLLMANGINPL